MKYTYICIIRLASLCAGSHSFVVCIHACVSVSVSFCFPMFFFQGFLLSNFQTPFFTALYVAMCELLR